MDSEGRKLLQLIQTDITLATYCVNCDGVYLNAAAYHIQQAFEKLLKLVLYSNGYKVNALKTHDLVRLIKAVHKIGLEVPEFLMIFAIKVTEWESSCRYDYDARPQKQLVMQALTEVKNYYKLIAYN